MGGGWAAAGEAAGSADGEQLGGMTRKANSPKDASEVDPPSRLSLFFYAKGFPTLGQAVHLQVA